MTALWGFIRSRLGIYVLVGAAAALGAASLYSYSKGYNAAEASMLKSMNKALKEQYDRMLVIAEKERKIELSKQRRKYEIQRNISGVTAPAGGCHLTPECVQWHDDILRAANPDLDRPD